MDKVSRNKKTSAVSRPKGSKAEECENPEDAKRAALVETPETRTAFKEFYRVFRLKERTSVKEAEEFAVASLHNGSVPEKSFWRVYLELADLAKRSNRFEEARRLFVLVCELQPYASQTWLEFSKLEEECGHMSRCARILHTGLQYCEMNENLLSRAIKHEEKMNNLARARELLARLKHVGIEKAWRTVLEGALLEGRAGNHATARRVLKYLMHHVPWYGPLYLEAYKLERDLGRHSEALNIVEKGLNAIPRYGPLWFAAFRLCETIDLSEQKYHLPRTVLMFERAATAISRELVWKVHLEASQIFERAALASMEDNQDGTSGLNLCRTKIGMTTLSCPSNLSWKVWLAGGRMELSSGNIETARRLFLRAHEVVPSKGRVATLLECARLEEYVGDVELARSILCKSRIDLGSEWKIWLESVLLEIRDNEKERALALAKQSTKAHPGTGRLWASLVQLRAIEGGDDAQYESLKQALKAVPKSGEVWCEGGRIHLNPFSKRFNLNEARRHLLFATRFTPQYGDGFLETIRLEIIELWLLPMASFVWEAVQPIVCSEESNPEVWVASVVVAAVKVILAAANNTAYSEFEEESLNKSVLPSLRAQLEFPSLDELLENSDLELRCANADPNYGSMWFNCRSGPTDTARVVLRCARYQIFADLKKHAHIYVGAMIRQLALAATGKQYGQENADEFQIKLLAVSEGHAVKAPSLESILQSQKAEDWTDNVLLERALSGFSSGLVALNEHKPLQKLSLLERKKALFGSDSLFS
jgi:la-related protein 1